VGDGPFVHADAGYGSAVSAAHKPWRLQCSTARTIVPESASIATETTGDVTTGERSNRAIGASPMKSSIQSMK